MQSPGNSNAPEEEATSPDWNGVERRAGDRRDRPTRPWSDLLTPRRRASGRRESDRVSYVDRYTRRDVALLLTVFLLNVGDAFLTMLWLSRGGREANPVMDFFLDIGPGAFLFQKCLMVGFWLVILLVHKNFRFARIGLYASLVVYALLMLLHFGILALGIAPPPRDAATEAHAPVPDEALRTSDAAPFDRDRQASDEARMRHGFGAPGAPLAVIETAGRPTAE
ncbi:MAG: DUF5658 family protein [Myxococcota bacterium]